MARIRSRLLPRVDKWLISHTNTSAERRGQSENKSHSLYPQIVMRTYLYGTVSLGPHPLDGQGDFPAGAKRKKMLSDSAGTNLTYTGETGELGGTGGCVSDA